MLPESPSHILGISNLVMSLQLLQHPFYSQDGMYDRHTDCTAISLQTAAYTFSFVLGNGDGPSGLTHAIPALITVAEEARQILQYFRRAPYLDVDLTTASAAYHLDQSNRMFHNKSDDAGCGSCSGPLRLVFNASTKEAFLYDYTQSRWALGAPAIEIQYYHDGRRGFWIDALPPVGRDGTAVAATTPTARPWKSDVIFKRDIASVWQFDEMFCSLAAEGKRIAEKLLKDDKTADGSIRVQGFAKAYRDHNGRLPTEDDANKSVSISIGSNGIY
eukprot:GHVS01021106.1.p1 GENE.GHVS01021106.1~~GHVS01021106.1.p1  ORF type:complete len:274 (+),score=15.22 GHVS01021106.1:321-1142(+)